MLDTIYAPATAIGGAIAIVRISGTRAGDVVKLLSRDITNRPGYLHHVRCVYNGETVDALMAVYFRAPSSYTGEDMVELHCHGGAVTVRRILDLLGLAGLRPAEPGEFTRRAFMNGKLDLARAEAVMDVVSAQAERSLRAAVRQLEGGVGESVSKVETILINALSGIDAAIDYPDEAENDTLDRLPTELFEARERIDALIDNGRQNRVLRDGLSIVILGRPNVGKSSLLNCLMGEERAIVTDIAGTTRDTLIERAVIRGLPVHFVDTAGIRETGEVVEAIGVERARRAAASADLLLLVLDGSMPLTQEDRQLLKETADRPRLILINKCDLGNCQDELSQTAISISAKHGEGIEVLKDRILDFALPSSSNEAIITNERHIAALQAARRALSEANELDLDCCATDIRDALKALGSITGTDVDETVIDAIFSRFCVGK